MRIRLAAMRRPVVRVVVVRSVVANLAWRRFARARARRVGPQPRVMHVRWMAVRPVLGGPLSGPRPSRRIQARGARRDQERRAPRRSVRVARRAKVRRFTGSS
jgi:hypothetical protein